MSEATLSPPPPPVHRHGSHDKHHEHHDHHSNRLGSVIHAGNSVGLLKMMMEEVSTIPYKTKKQQGASNDIEYVHKLIQEMNDILRHEFLHVDLNNCVNRRVAETDWSTLTACKRSDSGTTGIIFLQCITPQKGLEVVVAKPITIADFEKTMFVNNIATRYFHIQCPSVRLIERSEAEFTELEEQVKKLFLPLNEELYELGGHHSPKDLFSSQSIMLLEYVRGKPLCHKSQGQRFLNAEDYYALGKLFLLDMLIRNTDRLPCRKTMPRPGSKALGDHGNAGNIMFGNAVGEVWSIDPEMQTKVEPNVEQVYAEACESVIREVMNDEASKPRYKALDSLFFSPLPGLAGILDVSLNELSPWESAKPAEQEALLSILQLIRLRANAEDGYIIKRAGGVSPPMNADERDWREWIRRASPRVVIDIFEFLEAFTGFRTPVYAEAAFGSGFIDAIYAAQRFKSDFEDADGVMDFLSREGVNSLKDVKESPIDVDFVLRMIDRTNKHCSSHNAQPSKRYSFGGHGSATKSERRKSRAGISTKSFI